MGGGGFRGLVGLTLSGSGDMRKTHPTDNVFQTCRIYPCRQGRREVTAQTLLPRSRTLGELQTQTGPCPAAILVINVMYRD